MAGFRTITAKFPGVCRRCNDPFPPGTKVRWAKGRGSYHLAAACGASGGGDGFDRQYNRGRCEDAPCCGCGGVCGTPLGGGDYGVLVYG